MNPENTAISTDDVVISEVGPRDGLQNIKTIMPTEAKKAWIKAEAEAGITEIEVGSFVPAKLLPQLADTGELVRYARTIPGLVVAVLVPNLRGAEDAVAAGAHKITFPLSVSESHSRANLRMTHEKAFQEVGKIASMLKGLPKTDRPAFEGALSTAFGCTIEGKVSVGRVNDMATRLIESGCDEVGLSDTSGYANPADIRCLVRSVRDYIGDHRLQSIHLHNTRGLGLANALAALEEGIPTIDASLGGLGGCPFAPGASGNIVTEDLVFMLQGMGVATAINLEKLMAVRKIITRALTGETLHGFLAEAGIPKK